MTYPTTRPLKIKINGTDRTESIPVETIEITDVIGDRTSVVTAHFTVEDGGGFGLAELQSVVISNIAEDVRYFAGYIYEAKGHSRGPLIDYECACIDYAFDLEHPESLADGVQASKSDQWIIQNVVAPCIPDIDCTTHVEEVLADTVNMQFDQETPRQVLDKLAKLAGAEWYVDFAASPCLHYFDAGTNAAPFSLSNNPDMAASFPYDKLVDTRVAPKANKVLVIGAGAVTATRTTGAEGDYGRWLVTTHKDRNLTTTAQAEAAGDALLATLITAPSYSMLVKEAGLWRSGQDVTIVNAARSLNAAFEIKRVRTTFEGGGFAEFQIEVGAYIPELPELIAKPHQDAPHNAPLEHEHSGGADGPLVPVGNVDPEPYHPGNTHNHSFSASVTGTSAAGSSHNHSFSASVTGTSAAEAAHTHSFSASVTGESAPGSSHNHSFSASVTGTSDFGDQDTILSLVVAPGTGGASVQTSTVNEHYHLIDYNSYTTSLATHKHAAGTFAVSDTTGAEDSHIHDADDVYEPGTYAVSGTTGAGSSHTHGVGTFAVSGTSGAEASHTHGVGTFAVSGTTGAS